MFEEDEDGIKLDKTKFVRMINRVYKKERVNSKTGANNDKQMKTQIEKIIEEEAGSNF